MQESAIDITPAATNDAHSSKDRGDRTPTVTEIKKQKTNRSKKSSAKGKHLKNQKSDVSAGGKAASVEDALIKNIRASRKLESLDLSDDEAKQITNLSNIVKANKVKVEKKKSFKKEK